TTSMLSEVLLAMDKDPTLSVGGMLPSIGGNIRIGSSEIFVAEACEYTNSFLSFFPKIEIILNIDADHLDFFKDIDDIRASFKKFAALLPDDGLLLLQNDIPDKGYITDDLKCRVLTFGICDEESNGERPDAYATDITYDDKGHPSFVFHMDEDKVSFPVSLSVVGRHNVSNAVSVIAAALTLGGDRDDITKALAGFTGTQRRFEYKGSIGDIRVIDDYAHHPTEIAATLAAAKKYPHKKLYVAFQPHTYSRTKALLDEFAGALSAADEVILADIYAARETDTLGISSADLQERIAKLGTSCEYFPTFDEILEYILKKLSPGDVLITMGAGDIDKLGDMLLGR
ncbi:MAG: UDP-N-acetylmuramate--L-alanine ligase, partial [Lachnospiraceae bacterium]|nr:UDP-N-acetylmuramate--L-alanine ligase [Lachnospiraceae bacterium]